MAMEMLSDIKETHNKPVTAVAYNPMKHEILIGCEDGVIKVWDYSAGEPGKLLRTVHEHDGWVTCFLFWAEAKLLFSAANDGTFIAWGSGGAVHDRISIGSPIYSMAWNTRRNQLVAAVGTTVQVFTLRDPGRESGHVIDPKGDVSREHTDLVKCVVCHESRVYSAGNDQRLIVYDSAFSYHGKNTLAVVSRVNKAHDAGIICMCLARDSDNNTWIFTGGFDKVVKVWSQDGQCMHKFDGFSSAVTGVCYVKPIKTIWIAGGSIGASMYDPKSGDNVSDFIGTFQNEESGAYPLVALHYIPDLGHVIGTNTRRHIRVWRYNSSGCLTNLKNKCAVETLTYTRKVPLLIFSGGSDGQVTKWERFQSNNFMYSKEIFPHSEAKARLAAQIANKYDWLGPNRGIIKDLNQNTKQRPSFAINQMPSEHISNIALLRSVFVEDLDLLVVASEDHNIYVWGFDMDAVSVLQNMRPADESLIFKYAILLGDKVPRAEQENVEGSKDQDSVTNRVAGFICRNVLTEHTNCVTGLAVVGKDAGYGTTFLISAGWDRRILLWDLETVRLHDSFRNTDSNASSESEELASDGIILDLTYSADRDEFAYASSDKLVYIRRFSDKGREMKLLAVLQGHEADVTQVRWSSVRNKWVTGSEDGTIRVWNADGMSCELVLSAQGAVSALCIDQVNGCIVAGIQEVIRS
ncbi:probable U3 small nucleolar RNA-associated protein 13 isoform X2 [Nematostella vectensis]|uniref:probable U3 small nucleolar RNA-associated protein 13 isoform X2 n=1 Tax=Nematostella vectensis TaxID=45351 RepID=UPI002076D7B0|nr:probable U3 small nucleolar RNA-associated protein 13 isoform X2 [Nematostella vectensis]